MIKYIFSITAFIILTSCNNEKESIEFTNVTDPSDYEQYLKLDEDSLIKSTQEDLKELKAEANQDSTRIVLNARIAGKLDQLFNLTGDVEYLNESVRFRESVARNTYIQPENPLRSLAQAYIKQHRFMKADSVMVSFTKEYSNNQSKLIQFDVAMELGRFENAESLLDSLRDPNDYNYLIRAAKWNDHIGQLETTITLMERATKLAEQGGSKSNLLWSYSNIADYNGHNGQLDKSYEYYLKTLELDPNNTHALKGIAWIAYSNDGDIDEARNILERLKVRHPLPDYDLELAELYAFENKEKEATDLKNAFMERVDNPAYGDMYNAYMINELIDAGKTNEAVKLAQLEIINRATPETYDLLGYALLEDGQVEAAMDNHMTHVIGKTFEPVAQLHTALILKANNKIEESMNFKNELLETRYEMGPVTFKEIEAL